MSPAPIKEMVRTETRELDCIIAVLTNPKLMLFQSLLVETWRIFSSTPPEKALNPSSNANIPNRNMATPAEISLKSGLIQNPYAKNINIIGSNIFLNIISLLLL
jgi:hypothetical protein